ncbi:putative nudix protein [Lasiodiplodia theobromae]|nr:putative nudix protein [Lasiodiplodia theobromae]
MSPPAAKNARVGVGVFILNDKNQFIIGKRKGSHGAGTWALPGGHLEFGEGFEECAARETMEETGLETTDVRFFTATNSVFTDIGAHYVTIFMTARISGEKTEPENLEPEKCEMWKWVDWEELRTMAEKFKSAGDEASKLFLPLVNLFDQHRGISLSQA